MGENETTRVAQIVDRLGLAKFAGEIKSVADVEAATMGKIFHEASGAVFLQYRDEQTAIRAAGGAVTRAAEGFFFRVPRELEQFVVGLSKPSPTGRAVEEAPALAEKKA